MQVLYASLTHSSFEDRLTQNTNATHVFIYVILLENISVTRLTIGIIYSTTALRI